MPTADVIDNNDEQSADNNGAHRRADWIRVQKGTMTEQQFNARWGYGTGDAQNVR